MRDKASNNTNVRSYVPRASRLWYKGKEKQKENKTKRKKTSTLETRKGEKERERGIEKRGEE